jgi:hypothetical protein
LGKTGDVATRSRHAVDVSGADRINNLHEYDWHGAERLLDWSYRDAAGTQDDIGRDRGQFGRVFVNAAGVTAGPAHLDPHVAAFGPAQLL